MEYMQHIYCLKPICSSLADQTKNAHKMQDSSNHGKENRQY